MLLPALVDDYARLGRMADGVAQHGLPLFEWNPGTTGVDGSGWQSVSSAQETGQQWSGLAQLLRKAFDSSATNLQYAAWTVLSIEARYQATDHVSADDLQKAWDGQVRALDEGFPGAKDTNVMNHVDTGKAGR
ncbi:hypothetical protein [Actinocatenispora rupis]|uniref:hypothetical protein n=1 Tax=Actinocatenispora rupis TaxID=519421 RepID=UPI0019447E1A|nr:hypothetical protein [Actinocatenispora rupis]